MRLCTQQPTDVTDYSHRCWADCDSRRFAAICGDLLISDTQPWPQTQWHRHRHCYYRHDWAPATRRYGCHLSGDSCCHGWSPVNGGTEKTERTEKPQNGDNFGPSSVSRWSQNRAKGNSQNSDNDSLQTVTEFCPGFQKCRVPSEKGTFSVVNEPSKRHH